MNGRQRVMTALGLGVPDRVPTWDWFDEAVTLGVAEHLGLKSHDRVTTLRKGDETEASIDLYCRVVEALDVDGTSNVYNTDLKPVGGELGRDKYGRGYLLSDHGMPAIVEPAAADYKAARNYDMVSRLAPSDFNGLARVIERLGHDRAHCLNINGPFQEAWNVTGGMDRLMLSFLEAPDYAHEVLRKVTDFNCAVMTEAAALGVDFFMVDGDLCGNDFPLMSRDHFLEFIAPYKREMVEHAHALGRPIVKHSDGRVWALLDDLIGIGFDGFHPVQPQCMEMDQTKAHLSGRACVFGNVDCLDLLVFKGPAEVENAVVRCIVDASPGGGHVLCSSNSLHPGCRPENVVALFETARRYGDYDWIAATPRAATAPVDEPARERRRNRRRA